MARDTSQKLHKSLDAVARGEGFQSWDHLSAAQGTGTAEKILAKLPKGTLSLLAARPGQGKTLLALEAQCQALRTYARTSNSQIVLLSQIHRGSDASLPGPDQIRLPNPVDLSLFDRKIFLHDGKIDLSR